MKPGKLSLKKKETIIVHLNFPVAIKRNNDP